MKLQTNSLSEQNKGYQGYRKYNRAEKWQKDTQKKQEKEKGREEEGLLLKTKRRTGGFPTVCHASSECADSCDF